MLGRLLRDELRVCLARAPPWEEEAGRVEMEEHSVCSLREKEGVSESAGVRRKAKSSSLDF
jgi:hypothetical protein